MSAADTQATPAVETIGVFTGPTQYDAGTTFIARLCDAWREHGHDVVEIPDGEGLRSGLRRALERRARVFFGYNATGADVSVAAAHVFARIDARFIAWLVDHPVYHVGRLRACGPLAVVACVDATHRHDVGTLAANVRATSWVPHFGCDARDRGEPRDIDVLVPGTVRASAPIATAWRARGRAYEHACHEVRAEVTRPGGQPLLAAARDAAARHLAADLETAPDLPVAVAADVDRFVRACRRERVFEALARMGVRATACGIAGPGASCLEGHDWLGPLPFPATLALMRRARVVVDSGAAFPAGSHERGLSAALNGAAVCVESNAFWRGAFAPGAVALFDWGDREPMHVVRELLACEPRRAELASAGQRAVAAAHTVRHRAAALLDRAAGTQAA
jgi:hypothetical protein